MCKNSRSREALKLLGTVIIDEITQCDQIDEKILIEAFQLSVENRVFLLFYKKFHQQCKRNLISSFFHDPAEEEREIEVYHSILKEIANAASKANLKFLVFKTLKPFPYLVSDLDILLPTTNSFYAFTDILQKQGFRIMSSSSHVKILEKNLNGKSYSVDVHNRITAGGLEYIDKSHLWHDRKIYRFRGEEIYVPSPEWELVIIAAHSVLKEFTISLADFFYTLYLLKEMDKSKLIEIVKEGDLVFPFSIFIEVINSIHRFLYSSALDECTITPVSMLSKFLISKVKSDFKKNPRMPYVYPLYVPFLSHLLKLKSKPFQFFNILKNFSSPKMILLLFQFLKRFRR